MASTQDRCSSRVASQASEVTAVARARCISSTCAVVARPGAERRAAEGGACDTAPPRRSRAQRCARPLTAAAATARRPDAARTKRPGCAPRPRPAPRCGHRLSAARSLERGARLSPATRPRCPPSRAPAARDPARLRRHGPCARRDLCGLHRCAAAGHAQGTGRGLQWARTRTRGKLTTASCGTTAM